MGTWRSRTVLGHLTPLSVNLTPRSAAERLLDTVEHASAGGSVPNLRVVIAPAGEPGEYRRTEAVGSIWQNSMPPARGTATCIVSTLK